MRKNTWKKLSNKNNFPLQIFRLAGIYSNEFNVLKRLEFGKIQIVDKKIIFFQEFMLRTLLTFFLSLLIILRIMKFTIFVMISQLQSEVVAYGAKITQIRAAKTCKT